MSFPVHEERFEATTDSAAVTVLTQALVGDIVGVMIRPDTSTTMYDFTVKERDDFAVIDREGIEGEYCEGFMPITCRGPLTIAIANATNDEGFLIKILCRAV